MIVNCFQEILKLQQESQNLQKMHAVEKTRLLGELERLEKELRTEKAKAAGDTHRIEELQRLARDKSALVESLAKQLEQQQRRDKFSQFKSSPAGKTIDDMFCSPFKYNMFRSQSLRHLRAPSCESWTRSSE